MADRFDKFTERARRVLTYAQDEAQRHRHDYIGTEHLLLGLLQERDGVACAVLLNLGVNANNARDAVETVIGRGERAISGEIGLTPRAKKVIEFAVEEARRLNHSYIGTEHILLGLLREGEGVAAGILESLGVKVDAARSEIVSVLGDPRGAAGWSAGPRRFGSRAPGVVMPRAAEAGREELTIAPNTALRQAAVRMLEQARTALGTIQHDELARELIETLLTSQITILVELLNLQASTRQELDEAMSRSMHALSTIVAATSVIQPYNPVAGEALSTANLAVLKAMSR